MSENSSLLVLDDVRRSYGLARVCALRGVSLTVKRGEYVALTGPSGSGKSTLLNMLAGLDRPDDGRVLFAGREPRGRREWARIRARNIGFVFQAFHLLPALNAAENVEIPMLGVERRPSLRRQRSRLLLERVGLAHRADHRPAEMSGGECQRVAVARSLANRPEVILADEPTGNLDSEASAGILDLLGEINQREGTTLIIASHDAAVSTRADRVVHMLDGQIVSA